MGAPSLYAEFLLNIRQIAVYSTLSAKATAKSKLALSEDRGSISLQDAGGKVTIKFPHGISASKEFECPEVVPGESSVRFNMDASMLSKETSFMSHPNGPWQAGDLEENTMLGCRSCRAPLLDRSAMVWADLPREDWAEMMDFWHCHKPDSNDKPTGQESMKAYAAANRPRLSTGVGFINTCHIYLDVRDCSKVKVSGKLF
jgi:hypothetical protein